MREGHCPSPTVLNSEMTAGTVFSVAFHQKGCYNKGNLWLEELPVVKKKILSVLLALVVLGGVALHYRYDPWGFYWKVSDEEAALRLSLVEMAQRYLGCREDNGTHCQIIDIYNTHEPLAVDYLVQYTDSWCSTFVSAMAIRCGLTEIIPTECGCQRHIALFEGLGRWEERDDAIPAPGDLIFYDWDVEEQNNSTGWSDHVGIVVGVKYPFIKVIEGNKDDAVSYRILLIGDKTIRGYGMPDYAELAK